MKSYISNAVLATALLAPLAATHAQPTYTGAYTESETVTETTDGLTTETTQTTETYVATTPAVVHTAVPTVLVQLADGTTATIANTAEQPWYEDARIGGSRNFSFDAVSGAYVVYSGDKFSANWDEKGNRIKPKPVVKKKVVAPVEPVAEEPVAETPVVTPVEASPTTPAVSVTAAVAAEVTPTVNTTISTTVHTTTEITPDATHGAH